MNVVISQSMYFPWIGMLEQIRLSDIFVHYDDVQFSKGSFTNRVQVKQANNTTNWMTVPLLKLKFGQCIDEVKTHPVDEWGSKHIEMLKKSFAHAPYASEALTLAEDVLSQPFETIADLSRNSMLALCAYYDLNRGCQFINSRDLNISGSSSERVLEIVKSLGGKCYITGHGASKYLNHELFEQEGIKVSYMNYEKNPYLQSHGIFTPYVSGLDLVAHMGKSGIKLIKSESLYWREFKL